MKQATTLSWQLYEKGLSQARASGRYTAVRQNQRFYKGDQWAGSTAELPHPVFNLVRRITDYLVSAVAPQRVTLSFTDSRLPYFSDRSQREPLTRALQTLGQHASYRFQTEEMEQRLYTALCHAAISGDGVFYCWWDADQADGDGFRGTVRTDVIESTDLFVADPQSPDLSHQDYVILASRIPVDKLRREAEAAGVSQNALTLLDSDAEENGSVLTLVRFWREAGAVKFEKATRSLVIRGGDTGLTRYPIAYFQWQEDPLSFHGTPAVSDLIANQKYINTAYAMAMKHMSDTAFSKVIYDKSRIPEWSNRVGEAIGAMGGGNVSDAVSVVGVGKLEEGYLDLIDSVIRNTKDMAGATDSALGDEKAQNTSAILALQRTSQLSLRPIRARLYRCIGELALIWADMLAAYCPPERRFPLYDGQELTAREIPFDLLQGELLHAQVQVEDAGAYSADATLAVLDKLLDKGHLTPACYLSLLPDGLLSAKEELLARLWKGEEADA